MGVFEFVQKKKKEFQQFQSDHRARQVASLREQAKVEIARLEVEKAKAGVARYKSQRSVAFANKMEGLVGKPSGLQFGSQLDGDKKSGVAAVHREELPEFLRPAKRK